MKLKINGKHDDSRKRSFKLLFWLFAAKIAFIALCAAGGIWLIFSITHSGTGRSERGGGTFGQVLGSGYLSDGSQFWIASPSGVVFYNESKWKQKSDEPIAKQIRLLPLENGWIRINRQSATAEERNADNKVTRTFRLPQKASGLWAADYHTHELYHLVVSGGTYAIKWSTNLGKAWHHRLLHGIHGKAQMLAVDPGNSNMFAIATSQGLYLSKDGGLSFQSYFRRKDMTSVAYNFSAQPSLLAAYFDIKQNETLLYQVIPEQKKTINLDLDTIENDHVTQILTSPVHPQESVVLTAGNYAYQTKNTGQNWTILAQKGRELQAK